MIARYYGPEEIVRVGRERYEKELRAQVEAEHRGEFLALDIESGKYEIDATDIVAGQCRF
jgi:hypothetical protein